MKKRLLFSCAIFGIYLCAILVLGLMGFTSAISIIMVYGIAVAIPLILYFKYTEIGIRIKNILRGLAFCARARKSCAKLSIAKGVIINNPKYISFGSNCSVDEYASFYPLGGNYPSKIVIGNNVHIGSYNRFASMTCVEIEDDVLFAAFVHITDHSHEFKDIDTPVREQGVYQKGPVKIGKGSWLGFRCNVLSGVTIGEHSIVAAGSIVTKNVPSYSVVAGCPAKVIQCYDFDKQQWGSVKERDACND